MVLLGVTEPPLIFGTVHSSAASTKIIELLSHLRQMKLYFNWKQMCGMGLKRDFKMVLPSGWDPEEYVKLLPGRMLPQISSVP